MIRQPLSSRNISSSLLMGMPDEFALHPRHLDLQVTQFGNHLWTPVVRDMPKCLGETDDFRSATALYASNSSRPSNAAIMRAWPASVMGTSGRRNSGPIRLMCASMAFTGMGFVSRKQARMAGASRK